MPTDHFSNHADSLSAPARAPYAIVPSDSVGLTLIPRGIDFRDDVTYRNLPDASYIAVRAAFVRATGTTAGNLIAEA